MTVGFLLFYGCLFALLVYIVVILWGFFDPYKSVLTDEQIQTAQNIAALSCELAQIETKYILSEMKE